MSLSHSLKWAFLSEIAAKVIQAVVFIVQARIIGPDDVGVVSAAMMVISFTQLFWEAGMGKAIVQYQRDLSGPGSLERAADSAFWINMGLAIVVMVCLIAGASTIAMGLFDDSRVTNVLRMMSLQVFLSALTSIHLSLLQREMRFKRLFVIRFATVSLPGLLSIPMALFGMGYWAIVFGSILGQLAQWLLLLKISAWQPKLNFETKLAKELIRFGGWVAFSSVLGWFYVWADSFAVGLYLGAHDLGLYRTGSQFVIMVFSVLFSPVMPVLYSYLSKNQNEEEKSNRAFVAIIRIFTVIAVPLAFTLFLSGELTSDILFGSEWEGMGKVIGLIGLTVGFSWITCPNVEYFRGRGRPDLETKILLVLLPVYFATYVISCPMGLQVFLWSRFTLALFSIMAHWWFLGSNSNVQIASVFAPLVRCLLVPIATVMVITFFSTNQSLSMEVASIIVGVLLIFGSSLFLVHRYEWESIKRVIG